MGGMGFFGMEFCPKYPKNPIHPINPGSDKYRQRSTTANKFSGNKVVVGFTKMLLIFVPLITQATPIDYD